MASAGGKRPLLLVRIFIALFALVTVAAGSAAAQTEPRPAGGEGWAEPAREKFRWLFGDGAEEAAAPVDLVPNLTRFRRTVRSARKLYLAGDMKEAIAEYRKALNQFEAFVRDLPPALPAFGSLDEGLAVYDEFAIKLLGPIHLEPKKQYTAAVFEVFERRRICRRMLCLKKAGVIELHDVPAALLKREAELLERIYDIERQSITARSRESDALRKELDAVRRKLEAASEAYAILTGARRVPLDGVITGTLNDNELILDFNLLRDRLVIGVIAKEGAEYYQVPMKREEVDREVVRLQKKLKEYRLGDRSTFMGHAWKEPCRRVYRRLFGKTPPIPDSKTVIFVLPDRSLWYTPFSALLDAEDTPFGRNRVVSLIPSVDMLELARSRRAHPAYSDANRTLLLFESRPRIPEEEALAALGAEAGGKRKRRRVPPHERMRRLILTNPVYPEPSPVTDRLRKLFKECDAWFGPAATPARFMRYNNTLPGALLAAVPFAVGDSFDKSAAPSFYFSPGPNGKRQAPVRRFFDMAILSRLTVLPTAWFEMRDPDDPVGEGPLFAVSAFFYAGMPAVLMNYSDPTWGSEDTFITGVLEAIAGGKSVFDALAAPERSLPTGVDSSFSGRPPDWSGWILYGDPGR